MEGKSRTIGSARAAKRIEVLWSIGCKLWRTLLLCCSEMFEPKVWFGSKADMATKKMRKNTKAQLKFIMFDGKGCRDERESEERCAQLLSAKAPKWLRRHGGGTTWWVLQLLPHYLDWAGSLLGCSSFECEIVFRLPQCFALVEVSLLLTQMLSTSLCDHKTDLTLNSTTLQ